MENTCRFLDSLKSLMEQNVKENDLVQRETNLVPNKIGWIGHSSLSKLLEDGIASHVYDL